MESSVAEVEKLISESLYFEADNQLDQLLAQHPDQERLQQLKALCLTKLGNHQAALDYFEFKWGMHENKAESAGIMGSIFKSLFIKTKDPKYGKQSAAIYLQSFQATGSYYTGINAATMSKITAGQQAKKIAQDLVNLLEPQKRDYWQESTLAEAYLLLRDADAATTHYIKAREMMDKNWGAINSVRQQLWLLSHYTRVPKSIIEFFSPPRIVAFIGHMIDAPNRATPRFAPGMENDVRGAIHSAILNNDIQIGYTSLACGSDILFVEEMLKLDREVEIILPFEHDDFVQMSVAFAGDHWVDRFNQCLEKVGTVHYLIDDRFMGDDHHFHLLALNITGMAKLRGEQLLTDPYLFAVLSDYSLEAKTGGARDLLNTWDNHDRIYKINIDRYKTGQGSAPETTFKYYENRDFQLKDRRPALALVLETHESFDHLNEDQAFIIEQHENHVILIFKRVIQLGVLLQDHVIHMNNTRGSIMCGNYSSTGENQFINQAIKILQLAPEESILMNETSAALVKSMAGDLDVKYMGGIHLDDSGKKESLYRLSF